MSTPDPAAAVAREPAPAPGEYSHQQILRIIGGLMLAMFLGALDQTIVSTSIRTIADDLHGLSAQAWVTTAYLTTSTITTPIYGKLGDLWGRKRLFMFAITIFMIGSALCSFATSMYGLAAFRAVQGLGAGGLFTLVLAIIGDIVSPRERAKYTGYFMATFGSSSVLGPVIGGLLAGSDSILGITGWRWVFLVNVPIGLVALVVIFRTLHVHHVRRPSPIDWMGALALCVCLVPLLTVLEQGREWGWGTGRSIACFAIAAIGLLAFIGAEAKMKQAALIPLRLFTIRPAVVTVIASVIVGMGMFGGMMLLPLYMQIVHGATPTESGFLMLPMVAGLMTASITSGRIISRTGRTRMFPIFGSGLMALGMFALTTISADTHLWVVGIMMACVGYGVGNCMQPLMLTMQSSVPPSAIGMATSSATFFRQIGGTIGVAIFLSLLFGGVGANIQQAFADAKPQIQRLADDPSFRPTAIDKQVLAGDNSVFEHVQDDSSIIEKMNPVLSHPFKAGFADSISSVFWVSGGLGVVAFVVLLFMPEVELRQQSASAAVAAQRAEREAAAPGTASDD
ncbi:drug resistance transporter, EmrB/QacA subfamily [Nocardioides terrae]|uniref:Drug resistance transporter, EmrB/QacA subfamily n=1 Tax=Nocardioides terrae TaxID=574651 RepID=A0A1I1IRR7_9ACTN|nr:MDR family MFS transporter [Nocardioides terrae]SFC38402.1 drug resistance transporter, EmrB/QacA subfamily [Nocardioides terrae]